MNPWSGTAPQKRPDRGQNAGSGGFARETRVMPVRKLRPITVSSTLRAALGCALGAAVVLATVPASAGDDDSTPIDTKILRGFMEGLGLQRDGEGINYRERPPLVIPPNSSLPPPAKADAALANDPNWPKDPDVQRAKKEAAQQRAVSANPDQMIQTEANPLRPDQLNPPSQSRRVRRVDDGYRPSANGSGDRLSPSQLDGNKKGLFGNLFEKDPPEMTTFTGEPPRVSLTDPPSGYQTPSPDQPYGKNSPDAAPKPYDYMTQHGVDPQ